jgi:DNA-binding PadR family transcriptional regulator
LTSAYDIHYNLVFGAEERGLSVHGKFDGLGRFADPSLLILTSLVGGPKHGYAIMTDIAAFSGVRMEPGTLYGALSRLERRGWVRPLATEERRRPYEITAAGQEILAEQVITMQQIVQVARLRTATAWGT